MLNIIALRIMKHTARAALFGLHRLGIQQSPTQYYFGYGANLDSSRFDRYYMCYRRIGVAVLPDYQLDFSLACEYRGKGYASVTAQPGQEVWGVLYQLSRPALMMLDILEWVPLNFYVRRRVAVNVGARVVDDVWVYVAKHPQPNLHPSRRYFQRIIDTAQTLNFPESYSHYLRDFTFRDSFALDPGFRLSNPGKRRWCEHRLSRLYLAHDKLRVRLRKIV